MLLLIILLIIINSWFVYGAISHLHHHIMMIEDHLGIDHEQTEEDD